MGPEQGDNLDSSLRQLLEGFVSLSNEYKHLAEKHRILQHNLSAATEELALFKDRYSDRIPSAELQSKQICNAPTESINRRSLAEWLAEIRESESSDTQEAVSRIREAELACFGMRNRLNDAALDSSSMRTGSKSARHRVRIHEMHDFEQDFTTTNGTAGRLGCPFAPKVGINRSDAAQKHNLPTPRSSGSHLDPGGKSSKRASFNDPIRPKIHAAEVPSPLASEAGSNGPACPIRFLGNHPPEEVAKYFEEHKHEIPRSHEVCVKRFQSNKDEIRELDAKYGNLVNMIQGLGQKHQPMLPETPEPGEAPSNDEERRSNKKVQEWARTVSENQVNGGEENIPGSIEPEIVDGEERVPHFDRPLKEIRVGESPSRPWGVSIPSKYLDRVASFDKASPDEADIPAVVEPEDEKTTKPTISMNNEAAAETVALPKRQEGKCPFDHAAMGARAKPSKEIVAQDSGTNKQPPLPKAVEAGRAQETITETTHPYHLINKGIAVVTDSKYLAARIFENHGTLIVGYNAADAQKMLQGLPKHE